MSARVGLDKASADKEQLADLWLVVVLSKVAFPFMEHFSTDWARSDCTVVRGTTDLQRFTVTTQGVIVSSFRSIKGALASHCNESCESV